MIAAPVAAYRLPIAPACPTTYKKETTYLQPPHSQSTAGSNSLVSLNMYFFLSALPSAHAPRATMPLVSMRQGGSRHRQYDADCKHTACKLILHRIVRYFCPGFVACGQSKSFGNQRVCLSTSAASATLQRDSVHAAADLLTAQHACACACACACVDACDCA